MTNQRKIIAEIIENTFDHPDVEELYNRASAIDDSISIATVYRTVKLFEESGILTNSSSGMVEQDMKMLTENIMII